MNASSSSSWISTLFCACIISCATQSVFAGTWSPWKPIYKDDHGSTIEVREKLGSKPFYHSHLNFRATGFAETVTVSVDIFAIDEKGRPMKPGETLILKPGKIDDNPGLVYIAESFTGYQVKHLQVGSGPVIAPVYFETAPGVTLDEAILGKLDYIARQYYRSAHKPLFINSGTRWAGSQADAMFFKLSHGENILRRYRNKAAAKEIKDAYDRDKNAGKDKIIADLKAVIQKQIDAGTYISNHLKGGAVDIQTKDMSESDKKAFLQVVAGLRWAAVLDEGIPPHFHVDIDASDDGGEVLPRILP